MSEADKINQTLVMQQAAEALDRFFNGKAPRGERKIGFVLLTFPFGEVRDGRVNYVCNGDRQEVAIALRELLARWEGRYQEPGGVQ